MQKAKANNIIIFLLRPEMKKWMLLLFASFLVGTFLIFTSEVREASVDQKELVGTIDQAALNYLVGIRVASLSEVAVSITSLGSGAILAIVVFLVSVYLLFRKRFFMVLQLWLASLGAGFLTQGLKFYFERSRPEVTLRLVEVQGYSYPSGHSLSSAAIYFMLAFLIAKTLPMFWGKVSMVFLFSILVGSIGLSRMYLGVHYFSDVTAGVMLGLAWTCLIVVAASFFEEFRQRKET